MTLANVLLAVLLSLTLFATWSHILRTIRHGRSRTLTRTMSFAGWVALVVLHLFLLSLLLRYLWSKEDWPSLLWDQRDIGALFVGFFAIIGLLGVLLRTWKWVSVLLCTVLVTAGIDGIFRDGVWFSMLRSVMENTLFLTVVPALFACIGILSLLQDLRLRAFSAPHRFAYAFLMASAVSWILLIAQNEFFSGSTAYDPFILGMALLSILIGWKFFFSAGSPQLKTVFVATDVFWFLYVFLRHLPPEDVLSYLIAVFLTALPALLLLGYFLARRSRQASILLLSLVGGVASTTPIALYNLLAEHQTVVHFFFATVNFQSLPVSTSLFLNRSIFSDLSSLQATVLSQIIVYIFVGLVEEGVKCGVLRKEIGKYAKSRTHLLIMALLVALGYGIAENLLLPDFLGESVKTALASAAPGAIARVLATLMGHSVLVGFVHVLGTVTFAFFMGNALFATARVREQFDNRKLHPALSVIHDMLFLKSEATYQRIEMLKGFLAAIVLHGTFNILMAVATILQSAVPSDDSAVGALVRLLPGDGIILLSSFSFAAYVLFGAWLLLRMARFARNADIRR